MLDITFSTSTAGDCIHFIYVAALCASESCTVLQSVQSLSQDLYVSNPLPRIFMRERCSFFCLGLVALPEVSICPSIRLLRSLSQRLLMSLPESLLFQFTKVTAELFGSSMVDTISKASI